MMTTTAVPRKAWIFGHRHRRRCWLVVVLQSVPVRVSARADRSVFVRPTGARRRCPRVTLPTRLSAVSAARTSGCRSSVQFASVSRSVFATIVKLSSYRSDSSVAGGSGRVSSTGSGCYPSDYDVHSGGKTYRHKGRSKSATCKYVDEKSKKKKKSSTSPSRSSNSVSLVSIPNTIKLSMLNSGLLPLCKHYFGIQF